MNEAIAVVPVIYFAHPVAGRTLIETAENIARARRWFAWLVEHCRDHAFCAPWLPYLEAFDEGENRSCATTA